MTNRLCYVCEGGDCTEKGSGDVFDKLRDLIKRFDPNEYVDEHRARVEAAIQRKVEGKEVSFAEAPPAGGGATNVVDLMEVLKASLNARGKQETRERKGPKKAAAPGEAAASRKSRR